MIHCHKNFTSNTILFNPVTSTNLIKKKSRIIKNSFVGRSLKFSFFCL